MEDENKEVTASVSTENKLNSSTEAEITAALKTDNIELQQDDLGALEIDENVGDENSLDIDDALDFGGGENDALLDQEKIVETKKPEKDDSKKPGEKEKSPEPEKMDIST